MSVKYLVFFSLILSLPGMVTYARSEVSQELRIYNPKDLKAAKKETIFLSVVPLSDGKVQFQVCQSAPTLASIESAVRNRKDCQSLGTAQRGYDSSELRNFALSCKDRKLGPGTGDAYVLSDAEREDSKKGLSGGQAAFLFLYAGAHVTEALPVVAAIDALVATVSATGYVIDKVSTSRHPAHLTEAPASILMGTLGSGLKPIDGNLRKTVAVLKLSLARIDAARTINSERIDSCTGNPVQPERIATSQPAKSLPDLARESAKNGTVNTVDSLQ